MGRRAKGKGSIFQRNDGTWQGELPLGYNDEGKRKRKYVYGKTQRAVREKLDELKQQQASGTLSDTTMTMKVYLDHWHKEKSRQVKPRTAHDHRYDIDHYVAPRIGRLRLDKLTPLHIQVMMSEIADAVSADRANKCRKMLFTALKQAVRWQLIPRNPVEAVDPLKHERQPMKLWTASQATQFLDTAMSHRLYALFYVAMATGLRSCELLGLRWQDVQEDFLQIRQTRVKVGKKMITQQNAKSKKGLRLVAITPDVTQVLGGHRERQEAELHFLGLPQPEHDLVFISEVGTPIDPDNLKRTRYALMEQAEVPRVRLHDLRHLHASIAIHEGVDPKVLADRLGHARASFTVDTYVHFFEEQRAKSAVSITGFLARGKRDKAEGKRKRPNKS